jgi:hypothetical protein
MTATVTQRRVALFEEYAAGAAAIGVALAYWLFVARRLGAGRRGLVLLVVLIALSSGAYLMLMLVGTPNVG